MIRPGQLAEFRASLPVRLGIARDGDIVRVMEYRHSYAVGPADESSGYDAEGYAVECSSWGKSAVHPKGWWFCRPEWLQAVRYVG